MTTLIVEFDTETGAIDNWHYHADDDYTPGAGELEADVDHRVLKTQLVDTATDPPTLVDNPNWEPEPDPRVIEDRLEDLELDGPVAHKRVSEQLKTTFRDARSADDVQGQLDALFEMVTGDAP